MSKSVFMQLQMEAGLRASFQEAAERQHRPAAQVLRQLMREYVARESWQEVDGAPLEPAPWDSSGDRDLEAMAQRQLGWRCSPFGVG